MLYPTELQAHQVVTIHQPTVDTDARPPTDRARLPAVWTIGHGTRTADALIELLRAHGIHRLVDVRTIPRSRRNPQFNREALPKTLREAGIEYAHRPGLGGLRRPRPDSTNTGWTNAGFRGYADYMETEPFSQALEALLDLARDGATAIMCAETVPWRCHRSLIADALLARAIDVGHILDVTQAEPHVLTPWARVEGTRVTYPGIV
jgi:uncharacterized protein (DUF488 family)